MTSYLMWGGCDALQGSTIIDYGAAKYGSEKIREFNSILFINFEQLIQKKKYVFKINNALHVTVYSKLKKIINGGQSSWKVTNNTHFINFYKITKQKNSTMNFFCV